MSETLFKFSTVKSCYFNNVDFTRMKTERMKFRYCIFENVVFDTAQLFDTAFCFCTFKNVKFVNSFVICDTRFENIDMNNVSFDDTTLNDVVFLDVYLTDVDFAKAVFTNKIRFHRIIVKNIKFNENFVKNKFEKIEGIGEEIIGWKKCRDGKIVKLLIPDNSPRVQVFGDEMMRAEFVKVLDVEGDTNQAESFYEIDGKPVLYKKDEIVVSHNYDGNPFNQDSGGIYFLLNRYKVESYKW